MSDADIPKGPFTRWFDYGYDGWRFVDYPTLEAAVTATTYQSGPVIIMRPVAFKVEMLVVEGESV